jgi:hypothetical protein
MKQRRVSGPSDQSNATTNPLLVGGDPIADVLGDYQACFAGQYRPAVDSRILRAARRPPIS